jgi:myo-inositol 2-dehydrogenase/D-chiro-inositol 1-dehydrogenase
MINLCLFGAGRIGAIHAAAVNKHKDVQIRYIVDMYQPAALKLAEQYGATVCEVEAALADPEVQGVIIASSTDTHADLIELSAKAGKAIFCEKPIDLDLDRVNQCVETVKQCNVPCALGFNRRFDPQFSELKQAIVEKRVGELEMLSFTSRDPSPPPLEYIKVSGGLFKDMMVHDFDLARWMLNEEITEIYAAGSCNVDPAIEEAGDIDTALVVLKTASGKICNINNSRRAAYGYDQRIEAFGSEGMAQANNILESNLVITNKEGSMGAKPQHFFLERYDRAYSLELDNFIGCIRGEEEPLATINDGLQALLLSEAALKSYQTGLVVKL